MKLHPASEHFPLMDEERFRELVEDIRCNGQRQPIILCQDQILDGRNRFRACRELGITAQTVTLQEGENPYEVVWSLNGNRRDMSADQRYLVWKRVHADSDAWRRRMADQRENANGKRSVAAKLQPRTADGKSLDVRPGSGTSSPTTCERHVQRNAKASLSNTNAGAVKRGDWLAWRRPDLAEKVVKGDLPMAAAIREAKREETIARLNQTQAIEAKALDGVYDVIVVDPPWPMKKIDRDERPNQTEFDYPTMPEAELAALDLPCAENCHVWLWTTHKFLPMAFRLLQAWDLKYVCSFVWHKAGGFQPFGLPQYNCEFALYARRGAPIFIDTKSFPTCFSASRGAHSEKPEEFYATLRRVTAGRRLDMFNRRIIAGFDGWGKEAAK